MGRSSAAPAPAIGGNLELYSVKFNPAAFATMMLLKIVNNCPPGREQGATISSWEQLPSLIPRGIGWVKSDVLRSALRCP